MSQDSIASKLSELFDLYKSEALTKEEYDLLKSELLKEESTFNIERKDSKNHDILQNEKTKTSFEDRLKAEPTNAKILLEYALYLFDNQLFKEAIPISSRILAIDNNDSIAKQLIFNLYLKLDSHKEALEAGEQLLTDKSTDIILMEELVKISSKLGDSNKVLEYCNKILVLQPSNIIALKNKGLIFLKTNQLEKAIEVYGNLYKEGEIDRITTIYAGIEKALNGDYKSAIDFLTIAKNKGEIDQNDINSNRLLLYLAYSLCQSSTGLSEIQQLVKIINIENLKIHYHHFDEQVFVKVVEFIILKSLREKILSQKVQNEILELTEGYLSISYFTKESYASLAELWFDVGNKQFEFKLFANALESIQEASRLIPEDSKYKRLSAEIEKIISDSARIKRKKTLFTIMAIVATIILIAVSIFSYKSYVETKTWESSNNPITIESLQNYSTLYPNGKFLKDAEIKAWEILKKSNSIESLQNYLILYPKGKFVNEAKESLEKYGVLDSDGNFYHTVTIGTQVWMVENLKTTKYRNGDSILNITDSIKFEESKVGTYKMYNNDKKIANTYGNLYNWNAVNDKRNIAPEGWHVPTCIEWYTLINYLGGDDIAAEKLMESGSIHWKKDYQQNVGTNETGFTALPAGGSGGKYGDVNLGEDALWWSSTEESSWGACFYFIDNDRKGISRSSYMDGRQMGLSVRCIKDK